MNESLIVPISSNSISLILIFLLPVYTAIQGIIDATNNQLNEIERNCAEKNVVSKQNPSDSRKNLLDVIHNVVDKCLIDLVTDT